MVDQIATSGLVVTHSPPSRALVDEFATRCKWPLLTRPTIRTVVEQIELLHPACLVFWLDALGELTPAARLIAQLRVRGQRPVRIAVAHNLPAEVEHTIRAAGVHTYVTASGNAFALVECALRPFIPTVPTRQLRATPAREVPVPNCGPIEVRGSPAGLRPP